MSAATSEPSQMLVGDITLEGRITLVTGGGSGISLNFAQLAHASGSKIIIGDLRLTAEAESFVNSNSNVHFQPTNVTSWADLGALIATSHNVFGAVPDIYVAGAGVFEPPWSNFIDDKEEARYAELDINVGHPIKLCRIAIKALLGADKKGVFLTIASQAGLDGNYTAPLYCATKFAIVGFTKSMAPAERLEGVKVVAVCPGIVDTPLWSADKRDRFKLDQRKPTITTQTVAEAMYNVITQGKYRGGTIFGIRESGSGVVENQGPSTNFMAAIQYSDSGECPEVFGEMHDKMSKERGTGWKG